MKDRKWPEALNTFRLAGYAKALISFVKYCPQVYLNYSRKSTHGWSIINILLDFTGGSLSIVQQVLDMCVSGLRGKGWSFFGSGDGFNIVKFFLGINACIFDIIFMIQHYGLYGNNRHPGGNDEAKPFIDQQANSENGRSDDRKSLNPVNPEI